MKYKNTQVGTVMLLIMAGVMCLLYIASYLENEKIILLALPVLSVITLLFSSLTISVNKNKITWFFGPFFWRKEILIRCIESVRIVRNKWSYGLGIRLLPTGWYYSVSGLDAVELTLSDGNKLTLGTNEPKALHKTITSIITAK